MKPVNIGSVNGAHIGNVTSKDELMTKLEAVNATPEQASAALQKFDDMQAVKNKPAPKGSGAAKTMFDFVKQ